MTRSGGERRGGGGGGRETRIVGQNGSEGGGYGRERRTRGGTQMSICNVNGKGGTEGTPRLAF